MKEHKRYLVSFGLWAIVIALAYGILVDLFFKAPLIRENQFLMEISRKREASAKNIDRSKIVFPEEAPPSSGLEQRIFNVN